MTNNRYPSFEERTTKAEEELKLCADARQQEIAVQPRLRARATGLDAARRLRRNWRDDLNSVIRRVHQEGQQLIADHIQAELKLNRSLSRRKNRRITDHYNGDSQRIITKLQLVAIDHERALVEALKERSTKAARKAIEGEYAQLFSGVGSRPPASPKVAFNVNLQQPNLRLRVVAFLLFAFLSATAAHNYSLPGLQGHWVDITLVTLIASILLFSRLWEFIFPSSGSIPQEEIEELERTFQYFLLAIVTVATIRDVISATSMAGYFDAALRGLFAIGSIFLLDRALRLALRLLRKLVPLRA